MPQLAAIGVCDLDVSNKTVPWADVTARGQQKLAGDSRGGFHDLSQRADVVGADQRVFPSQCRGMTRIGDKCSKVVAFRGSNPKNLDWQRHWFCGIEAAHELPVGGILEIAVCTHVARRVGYSHPCGLHFGQGTTDGIDGLL
tara:strand:- start:96 stop:521 length:426 start_codon:yes stop_codon:yes gene_type:complete